MSSKTLALRTNGHPILVSIRASYLELEVIADAATVEGTAILAGPPDVLDKIREQRDGDSWTLEWPATPGAGGGMSVINVGGGTVIMGGGIGANRNVTINGVRMEDLLRAGGGQMPEPIRATLRVPAGSGLDAGVQAGQVVVRGPLAGVKARTVSADVLCHGETGALLAQTTSGDIETDAVGRAEVQSVSGDIRIGGSHGATKAKTTSGDISVHALADILVNAGSVSGDVRVTAAPGARPVVSGNSVSGRVRTC